MATYGIGILGAARITQKALVEPAKVMPRTRLAVIAARDPARADAYAKRHGIDRAVAIYDEVVSASDTYIIYNPLPINLHAEWTIKALEAGKHVLCEKPFAMNADEARAMLAAAETSGKRLVEAFHYRYHPAFEDCLAWIKDGRIGDVREIDATFNVAIPDNGSEIRHRVDTGGGAMMDLGCYPLHWALGVMEAAPSSMSARAQLTPTGVDESMQARLEFPTGATATLSASMAENEPFKAAMTIRGSKGEIEFINPIAPHNGARLALKIGPATITHAEISPISTYTWQLAALISALETHEPLPTEGDMILRQQEALDGIYAAAGLRHLRYLTR